MDRLSAYAARESESETPEDRQKTEEQATANLLEKLRISKESKKSDSKVDGSENQQPNGEVNGHKPSESPDGARNKAIRESETSNGIKDGEKSSSRQRGIPENVRLYEIFYEQVTHLVNAQRLHIQDTIALLVSLSNLAL